MLSRLRATWDERMWRAVCRIAWWMGWTVVCDGRGGKGREVITRG